MIKGIGLNDDVITNIYSNSSVKAEQTQFSEKISVSDTKSTNDTDTQSQSFDNGGGTPNFDTLELEEAKTEAKQKPPVFSPEVQQSINDIKSEISTAVKRIIHEESEPVPNTEPKVVNPLGSASALKNMPEVEIKRLAHKNVFSDRQVEAELTRRHNEQSDKEDVGSSTENVAENI